MISACASTSRRFSGVSRNLVPSHERIPRQKTRSARKPCRFTLTMQDLFCFGQDLHQPSALAHFHLVTLPARNSVFRNAQLLSELVLGEFHSMPESS